MTRTARNKQLRSQSKAQNQLRKQAVANGCPTPDKHHYLTYEEAESALMRQWAWRETGRKYAVRVYECPCGYFHLTKKAGIQIVNSHPL